MKSTGVYKCPDDPTGPATIAGDTATYYPLSYAMNINLDANYNNSGLAQAAAPASTVMIVEMQTMNADLTNVSNDPNGWAINNPPNPPAATSTYGSEEVNGGDGHDGWAYELNNHKSTYVSTALATRSAWAIRRGQVKPSSARRVTPTGLTS